MSKLKSRILIALAVTTVLIIVFVTLIIYNMSVISDPYMNEQHVDKQSFKGEWPFTVDEGVIRCDKADSKSAISFGSFDGLTYALNDSAQVYSDKNDLRWQALYTQNIKKVDADINDVIKFGLELCIE